VFELERGGRDQEEAGEGGEGEREITEERRKGGMWRGWGEEVRDEEQRGSEGRP